MASRISREAFVNRNTVWSTLAAHYGALPFAHAAVTRISCPVCQERFLKNTTVTSKCRDHVFSSLSWADNRGLYYTLAAICRSVQ